jgi:catechol 2,3-dioxygenase
MTPTQDAFDIRQSALRIGRVTLKVRDLDKVTEFYETSLGLRRLSSAAGHVILGSAKTALLELIATPSAKPRDPREAGLFHIAFLLPSRAALGAWLAYLIKNRLPVQGASDHIVSEAIYLADPEGNGIEVYADSPLSQWHDASGNLLMGTKPLDAEKLLLSAQDSTWSGFPDDGLIGHMHLQVGDADQAEPFYRDIMGLSVMKRRPQAAFFGSDGYHHHVACNTWNSQGAGMRSADTVGLASFDILVRSPEEKAAILARASQAGIGIGRNGEAVSFNDPWGNLINLVVA